MLRRKLLYNLGPLVGLLLVTAVVAIVMLQGVLKSLNAINHETWVIGQDVNALSISIHTIEVNLYELRHDSRKPLDDLIDSVDEAQSLIDRLGAYHLHDASNFDVLYQRIRDRLPEFRRHLSALATTQDVKLAMHHHDLTIAAARDMRQNIMPLSRAVHDHARAEQEAVSGRFRWVVLGLSLVFVLVINVSVIVLLRIARMVLRPLDSLVEAARQLSDERLDYRVRIEETDEFGQLARAYNDLADRLQANERRKMETLGQVALAMNHELNNVASIITLQLKLAERQAPGNAALEACLKQIQGSLTRMTEAVVMLKNVRRIVLTDYTSGIKMLDLRASAEDAAPAGDPVAPPKEATAR